MPFCNRNPVLGHRSTNECSRIVRQLRQTPLKSQLAIPPRLLHTESVLESNDVVWFPGSSPVDGARLLHFFGGGGSAVIATGFLADPSRVMPFK